MTAPTNTSGAMSTVPERINPLRSRLGSLAVIIARRQFNEQISTDTSIAFPRRASTTSPQMLTDLRVKLREALGPDRYRSPF